MKKSILSFLVCTSLSSGLFAEAPLKPAATAINALGIDLLHQTGTENTLLSPYSIQTALVMTYAGASGITREQMAKTLHYPASSIDNSFSALQRDLQTAADRSEKAVKETKSHGGPSTPFTLTVANRLFGQEKYPFRPGFLNQLKTVYEAPIEWTSFEKDPNAATDRINHWVEDQTHRRIQNLIPKGALDNLTRLVLVNAIYLKVPWETEFKPNQTQPRPFQTGTGTQKKVPTMQRQGSMGYLKEDGYEAVTLPYSGHDLQFLVLLPEKETTLSALEKKLTPALLAHCASLKATEVQLALPKFNVQPPLFALRKQLATLGMPSAFDIPKGSANFDGMAPRKPNDYLAISDIFHKTFIELDEKGTEAAAATAVVMVRKLSIPMEPKNPIPVIVDRPFFFAIQHVSSGACLFLGRVTDPEKN